MSDASALLPTSVLQERVSPPALWQEPAPAATAIFPKTGPDQVPFTHRHRHLSELLLSHPESSCSPETGGDAEVLVRQC